MTSVTVAPFSTDCPAIGKVLITVPGVTLSLDCSRRCHLSPTRAQSSRRISYSLADNSWHHNPDWYRDDHDDSRAFVDQLPC